MTASRPARGSKPAQRRPDRRRFIEHLKTRDQRQFDSEVLQWVTGTDDSFAEMAPVFRGRNFAALTMGALTEISERIGDKPANDDMARLKERVDNELDALMARAMWGREVPAPLTAMAAPLTEDDEEEILWAVEADDDEFREAITEWLTLGDTDGSGRRVFLSPQVAVRTHRTLGDLLRDTALRISTARAAGDQQTREELRSFVASMEQVRRDTRKQSGRGIRIRRSALDDFRIPEPTPADRREIETVSDLDDATLRGEISQRAEMPNFPGVGAFLSPDLVQRTLPLLRGLLFEALDKRDRARAAANPNPDRIAHLERRVNQLSDLIGVAKRVDAQLRRQARQDAPPSPREQAYQVLEQVHRDGRRVNRAERLQLLKENHRRFADIRHRLAAGEDFDTVVAEERRRAAAQ